jgi:hypothetical protein
MKRLIRALMALLALPLAVQIRTAVVNLWNNVRSEVVQVEEWGQTVIVRGLTLDEWLEYNRMGQLLSGIDPNKKDSELTDSSPPAPEPWQKYGHRALYAFVLVATLHDRKRRPVFGLAGTPERAQDIADVAAGFSDIHDRLVATALRLSGVQTADEGEAAPDPVDAAGNG